MAPGWFVAMAVAGGLGMCFGIGGFFEWAYYRRRAAAGRWKCQPERWPSAGLGGARSRWARPT